METTAYDPALLLAMILKRTATQLKTEHGYVGIIDIVHQGILVEFGMGMSEHYMGDILSPYISITGEVLRSKATLVFPDYAQWSGYTPDKSNPYLHRVGAAAAAPVILHNSIVAILVFIFENVQHDRAEEILKLVRHAGEHASTVLSDLDKIVSYPPLLIMPSDGDDGMYATEEVQEG